MTVNMRLIGPMAMALGISWNIVEPNEVEKGLIIDWMKGMEPTLTPHFEQTDRTPNMKTVLLQSRSA